MKPPSSQVRVLAMLGCAAAVAGSLSLLPLVLSTPDAAAGTAVAFASAQSDSPLPPGVSPGDVAREARGSACAESSGVDPSIAQTYVVKPGDTLGRIARQFDRSVTQLTNGNCDVIVDPNVIRPGMRLFV